MKKIIAMLLCLAMLLSYAPAMLFSASADPITDIEIPVTPDDEVDTTEPEATPGETTPAPEVVERKATCAACGKEVVWTEAINGVRISSANGTHFYLSEDFTIASNVPAITVAANAVLCVDLNGKSFTTTTEISVEGVLNIQGKGSVGGNIVGASGDVGEGDVDFDELTKPGTYDAALFNIADAGVVNIYGGTYSVANDKPIVTANGTLNMLGGEIAGTVNAGNMTLDGDAKVTLIEAANLTVKADWTGEAVIADAVLENGVAEGNFTGTLKTTEGKDVFNVDGKLATELPVKMTGITVTAPTKVEYELEEELALDGMVVTAVYSDGTTGLIAEGFTVTGFDSETAGNKTVTVTYGEFTATFKVTVKEAAPLESEVSVAVANAARGITVTWTATNAEAFRVYYRVAGETKWTLGAETTSYTFNHNTAAAGTTYEYKVVAVAKGVDVGEAVSAQITYVKSPTPTVSNVVDGVQIAWTAAAGSEAYYIYRADFDVDANAYGEFTKIGETTDVVYVDSTAKAGAKYSYQVRVVSNGEESVSVDGVTIIRIPLVTITEHTNTPGGMKINWNPVDGAAKYRLYRAEVIDGVWTWKHMEYFSSTDRTYTDLTGTNGVLYKYYVVGLNGSYYGPCGHDYPAGREELATDQMRLTLPALNAVNQTKGIELSWRENKAATSYLLYRSQYVDGNWTSWGKPILETTDLYYMDESAVNGVYYRYLVRAKNGEFLSGYKDAAILHRLERTNIQSIVNNVSYITISWEANPAATKYAVYRSDSSDGVTWGKWTRLDWEPGTSFDDYKVTSGTYYRYRITTVKGTDQSSALVSDVVRRIGNTTVTPAVYTGRVQIVIRNNSLAKSYTVQRRVVLDAANKVYGEWETIIENTTELEVWDRTTEAGVSYQYRANANNGAYTCFSKPSEVVTAK